MNVPLLDLKAQYAVIKPEVDTAIAEVLESQHFILGPKVEDAVTKAAAGDADAAVSLVRAFYQQPEPVRADRYYRASTGQIVAESGPKSCSFRDQIRKGEIVPLTEAEVKLYLEGRLDGHANH